MQKIEHLVVLVLENRSFDHLLGGLRVQNPDIDGPLGTEFNCADPASGAGKTLVSFDAPYVPDVDPGPGHGFENALQQLFMNTKVSTPIDPSESNLGFALDYRQVCEAAGQTAEQSLKNAGNVLRCFGANQLPALHTLAREFAICNKWFSSVPGPTWPNRFFIHCATSGGFLDNELRDYGMRTIFQNLSEASVDWRVYYHDVPQTLALRHQRQYLLKNYEFFDQAFIRDCRNGNLPQYSFIEPRYHDDGASRANDQHPIHGVALGDGLIADIYEAMRSSQKWEASMLVVTWDEHGGFYDHVLPGPTVNPDDSAPPAFDFRLLGARVPAIIVSPFVPKGFVDDTVYDHSSICATLKKVFGTKTFLTHRDAQANTFETIARLEASRPDTPVSLGRIPNTPQGDPKTTAATELHESLTAMIEKLVDPNAALKPPPATEQESADRVKPGMDQLRSQAAK